MSKDGSHFNSYVSVTCTLISCSPAGSGRSGAPPLITTFSTRICALFFRIINRELDIPRLVRPRIRRHREDVIDLCEIAHLHAETLARLKPAEDLPLLRPIIDGIQGEVLCTNIFLCHSKNFHCLENSIHIFAQFLNGNLCSRYPPRLHTKGSLCNIGWGKHTTLTRYCRSF